MAIQKAAVIGAGVMGSGIAAQIANAGVPVLLLDVPAGNGGDRSALAKGAIQRMLKTEPAPFMHRAAAKLVEPGNTEDDIERLAEVDWIVEVVVEDLEVKRALYARIEAARKDGSIVSSNTPTLPLAMLVAGQPERFARDFLITHFFNPPRYMRLLELVTGAATRPEALAEIQEFADRRLGKSCVLCNDTPGFVANRIGNFWLQCAVNAARDHGLTVEEADAVMSRPLGIPKTGVFGLLDLVGLDLIPKVDASLAAALPEGDAYHGIRRDWDLLDRLIAAGLTRIEVTSFVSPKWIPQLADADELAAGRAGQRFVLLVGNGIDDGLVNLALERWPPHDHLIENDAESPDIRAPVGGLSQRLFGRHVDRSS